MLPEDVDPYVMAFGMDDIPVVMLAVGTGDDDAQKLAEPIEDLLVPELESISGVRAVQVTGCASPPWSITPDEDKLEKAGYTVADLATALQASGRLLPGGQITEEDRTLTVTTGGRLESIEDVENIWLTPSGAAAAAIPGMPGARAPEPVQLSEVADVELVLDEATSITRTNGEPSLGILVTKTPDGNTVEVSEKVQERATDIADQLGDDISITVVFDQAPFINDSIPAMAEEGLLGLGFAVLVILVFLLSVRSTIVTAVSIPVSLLIAILGMWGFDYTLNLLTLGGLTVAVGRVVDDSIVVLENIKRHLSYGEDKHTAVLTGVREVAVAITSATLTTIAVFLPIGFVSGEVGELFRPFAVTVSIALAASLLVSLTIIPVLAYWFMQPRVVPPEELERVKAEEYQRELRSPLQRAYLPVIRWATKHRGPRCWPPSCSSRHARDDPVHQDELHRRPGAEHRQRRPGAAGRHLPGGRRRRSSQGRGGVGEARLDRVLPGDLRRRECSAACSAAAATASPTPSPPTPTGTRPPTASSCARS